MIYSTAENPLGSCLRTVEGSATYAVVGWFAGVDRAVFLMPMTLINLASLAIMIIVLVMAKGEAHDFDPAEARELLTAGAPKGQTLEQWGDKVVYQCRRRVSDCSLAYGFVTEYQHWTSPTRS